MTADDLEKVDSFLGIGGPEVPKEFCDYEKAKVAILPIPYEGTVSYGAGTAKGPQAIINASAFIELYDEELEKELHTVGIATVNPVVVKETPEAMMQEIQQRTQQLLEDNKFVIGLGGEHSVSQGIFNALKEKFDDLAVLQIDAHSDLRDKYHNTKYSHAAVMRRISEQTKDIVQVGIRSQDIEEVKYIKDGTVSTSIFYAKDIVPASKRGDDAWMEKVIEKLRGKKVFITFDIDAFDPSIIPTTGTPEPGGMEWYPTLKLLRRVFKETDVVGCDVVELAPQKELPHADFTTAKLVYKMIGYKFFQ